MASWVSPAAPPNEAKAPKAWTTWAWQGQGAADRTHPAQQTWPSAAGVSAVPLAQ